MNKGSIVIKSEEKDKKILKEEWIEILRTICILAVILNHTCMTIVNNYEQHEVGTQKYLTLNIIFLFVRFAVPCFVMITGYLLLDSNKSFTFVKLRKYVVRMGIILAIFGVGYAILELVFNEHRINVRIILKAVLNTLEGNSWNHMWYIYTLIGLYLFTPILRAFMSNASEIFQRSMILILFCGNCIIPTVNGLFHVDIENYMVVNVYVMYYILGGYIKNKGNIIEKYKAVFYCLGIIALFISCLTEYISIKYFSSLPQMNHGASNIITPFCAIAIFIFIKNKNELLLRNNTYRKVIEIIATNSFGMFLIHPIFLNFLYKFLGISPLNFRIVSLGVLVIFIIVTMMSILGTMILKKVPILRSLL